MVLAGLDIATTTGCCILKDDSLVLASAFHWEGKNSGQVFRHFRKIFYRLIEKYEIQHVAAEEPLRTDIEIPGRKNEDGTPGEKTRPPMKTFQRIYGLCAIAEETCAAHDVPFQYVHQGTWRRSFTGKGNATKDDSLALARMIDKSITSYDVAEAIGVAWHLRGQLNPKYAAPRGDLFEPTIQKKGSFPF